MNTKNHYCFLTVGKTAESSEGSAGFKRYVGVGSTYVLAVNPDKKKRDELLGFESQSEPEYVVDGENGKEVRITFIVRTDPESNNGIEITNPLVFTLRNAPAYSKDKTTVQVIDPYGNTTWASVEDVKAKKQLPANLRIDQKNYRMAAYGEADLVAFLKQYLVVPNSLSYVNDQWVLGDKAEDGKFELEHIKDYFNGDFSELRQAIGLQPKNKVKLLYGVRTADTEKGPRQYQAIATRANLILRNSAGEKAYTKLDEELARSKEAGAFPTTEFKVCDLQEWNVEATDFSSPASDASAPSDMPWD